MSAAVCKTSTYISRC